MYMQAKCSYTYVKSEMAAAPGISSLKSHVLLSHQATGEEGMALEGRLKREKGEEEKEEQRSLPGDKRSLSQEKA